MVKFLKSIGYFLERLERNYPRSFWFYTGLVALLFNFSQSQIVDEVGFQRPQPSTVIETNLASVLAINSGGGNLPNNFVPLSSKRNFGSFVLQTVSGKRKKFNRVFHRRLKHHFPDWNKRIEYQKKQEKFYKLAMKRRKEIKRVGMLDKKSYYTKEELDAMDYFHGTGFYKQHQDPKVKPNIFDTRQTFLLKMHDPLLRNNFLTSLNRKDDSN